MTSKMELQQEKNERILNFVRKHDTKELFERLRVVCKKSNEPSGSRIKKFEYITTVLKERVSNNIISYDYYRSKIDKLRMKF